MRRLPRWCDGDMLHLGENLTSKDVCDIAAATMKPRESARHLRVMGESLGIALATLGERLQLPALSAERRYVAAWEFFAPEMLRTVERRSFTYRPQGRDAHRASHARHEADSTARRIFRGREVGFA